MLLSTLATALALLLAQRITGSIHALVTPALALGSGEPVEIDQLDLTETNEVSQSLVNASQLLQQRTTERERAEESLRQNREWLRVALSSIGDAVLATDTTGRVTFVNPVAATLTGWKPEEAQGQPIQSVFQIINEQTRAPAKDIVSRVLKEGHVFELANHTALLSKDGREIPLEDSAAPIRDGSGNPVGVVLVFRDVTEKRRAQQRIAHVASFPELNPSPIFETDLEGKVTYANPSAQKLFPSLLEGGASHPLLAGWASVIAKFTTGSEARIVREVETDGRVFHQTIHYPRELGLVRAYFADITERKRDEAQLQKLNRALIAYSHSTQAMLHAKSEPALLDRVCRIVTEDCGYRMVWIGFAENDANKTVRPVAHAGLEEGYLDLVGITWAENERGSGPGGMAIRTGQPSGCPNMLTDPQFEPWRKDALQRGYASSLVLPLILPSTHSTAASAAGPDLACGKVFGTLTIYSKDVDPFSADEVKLLSDLAADLAYGIGAIRLRVSHAQAEAALLRSEKLASVGRMAATIAHEINNPLEAVMNLLFLANSATDPESVRQYLEIADEELKRVAHITRQSLGFYRESTAPAPTSVAAVLESALDLLQSKIKAKQAVIEKQWNQDVEITAVAGELRQVFSNLLTNSLDAIDERGVIKLRVSSGAALRNGRRCVRVTIADNGKGIDDSSRPHIFEPFFTTKGTVGTGLGLWVSKQIIDKHRGTIHMRSSNNGARRGTVFSVVLPAEPAAAAFSQSAGA